MSDPDAWLAKPQPTPELCRLFHGIDCRRCVDSFGLLDKLITLEAHHRADEWRRDYDERQRYVQAIEHRIEAERQRLLSALTAAGKRVDGPARALVTEIAKELSNG